jgi:Amino acid synthesis
MIQPRRLFTQVERISHEFGPPAPKPLNRAAAVAVIANPFAGRYEPLIAPFMDELQPLGLELARSLLAALEVRAHEITGYGKGAIAGAAGELEHAALWHVPGGYAMRETLGWTSGAEGADRRTGNALAIVPSTKKVGPPGVTIDIPLTHLNASYVRSHLDAMEIRVPGAPRADELVLILAMSTGPRVHERVGGLRPDQIERWDGQR